MNQELARIRLQTESQKKLGRLYLYASASLLPESFLKELKETIMIQQALSEEEFYKIFSKTCVWWQNKIEQFDVLLSNAPLVNRFERKSMLKGKPDLKMKSLLISLLSLSFQKLSIQEGKNHLTKKNLALLEALFLEAKYEKYLFYPFWQVQKGYWKVTSEEFLFEYFFLVQLLCDYVQAIRAHHSAKQALILELFKIKKKLSVEEKRLFLTRQALLSRSSFLPPSTQSLLLSRP